MYYGWVFLGGFFDFNMVCNWCFDDYVFFVEKCIVVVFFVVFGVWGGGVIVYWLVGVVVRVLFGWWGELIWLFFENFLVYFRDFWVSVVVVVVVFRVGVVFGYGGVYGEVCCCMRNMDCKKIVVEDCLVGIL